MAAPQAAILTHPQKRGPSVPPACAAPTTHLVASTPVLRPLTSDHKTPLLRRGHRYQPLTPRALPWALIQRMRFVVVLQHLLLLLLRPPAPTGIIPIKDWRRIPAHLLLVATAAVSAFATAVTAATATPAVVTPVAAATAAVTTAAICGGPPHRRGVTPNRE